MTNLKHCPFCGGDGLQIDHAPTYMKEHPDVYWVSCFDCGARGSEEWTTATTIAAWNTRAEQPIVRCKDCRECSYDPLYDTYLCNYWAGAGSGMRNVVRAFGFCAWGEPREGSDR